MMSDMKDRLQRLRRAGRLQRRRKAASASATAPSPERDVRATGLLRMPGASEVAGPGGTFVLRTVRFDLDHVQGSVPLHKLLQLPASAARHLAGSDFPPDFDFRGAVFIDTETTGLAGGTGTIVFLTGVGRFEDDAYVVYQFFARHPGEEAAYLAQLADMLAQAQGLISFNGKAFDLPLLRTRFLLAGLSPDFIHLPHLDLLHPARRLWRERLHSCTLGRLEQHILQHRREMIDIPSWQIPDIWFRFVRGEANEAEIAGVLYHNQEDIVSMAPLAYVLAGTLCGEVPPHPHDVAALARHRQRMGDIQAAIEAYQQALAMPVQPEQRYRLLWELAALLKRAAGHEAAAPYWETLSTARHDTAIQALVELAKYHEWQIRDYAAALHWTDEALAKLQQGPGTVLTQQRLAELQHRRRRLLRKIGTSK